MSSVSAPSGPLDRIKILTSPGIFGVFSIYRIRAEYYQSTTRYCSNSLHTNEHKATVVADFYLTRGLCHAGDFFIRSHSENLMAIQEFLIDFRKTEFGTYFEEVENLVGISKPLNYITSDRSPQLNANLFSTTYSDAPPKYAIMIPIKKNAQWWTMSPEERLGLMESHTSSTLPWLSNVHRKLYHSMGLCDADFLTYFETNDLIAFNNLILALAQVPENKYHSRYGDPVVLGSISTAEAVINALS
eukprot:gene5457-10972_t